MRCLLRLTRGRHVKVSLGHGPGASSEGAAQLYDTYFVQMTTEPQPVEELRSNCGGMVVPGR